MNNGKYNKKRTDKEGPLSAQNPYFSVQLSVLKDKREKNPNRNAGKKKNGLGKNRARLYFHLYIKALLR